MRAYGRVIPRHKGRDGKEWQCAFRIIFATMDTGMHGFLRGVCVPLDFMYVHISAIDVLLMSLSPVIIVL